jgi:hypothetical protein
MPAGATRERRVDLIANLHQHAGHRHQDKIAIDDVAKLVADDRALLVLAQNSKMPCVTTMRAFERSSP